jgi:hypothetical protein
VAAADVGDPGAGQEALVDAVQRRDPALDQVSGVAGTEEPLAALEDPVVVQVPAHADAGADRGGHHGLVADAGGGQLEGAGHERGAALVGQRERLLVGEVVATVRRVVAEISAGGLPRQPLGEYRSAMPVWAASSPGVDGPSSASVL